MLDASPTISNLEFNRICTPISKLLVMIEKNSSSMYREYHKFYAVHVYLRSIRISLVQTTETSFLVKFIEFEPKDRWFPTILCNSCQVVRVLSTTSSSCRLLINYFFKLFAFLIVDGALFQILAAFLDKLSSAEVDLASQFQILLLEFLSYYT